jgi:hypothetical protein
MGMSGTIRRLLLLTLVASLVAPVATAIAGPGVNHRRPPRVALRYQGEVVQRATPYTYCWSYTYPDNSGIGMCADGFPSYPEAASVSAPSRLVLRVPYPAKPRKWFINAYRAVNSSPSGWDSPVGPREEIPFRLKPHRVQGEVKAWDVLFRVAEPLRDYYIDTGGLLEQGDVYYALHVRTTP